MDTISDFSMLVENVITCSVCLKHYDQPRILKDCEHTFCLQCLLNLSSQTDGDIKCPKDDGTKFRRDEIDNLHSNTDLENLVKLFQLPDTTVPMCQCCEGNEAKYWCDKDCKKCFCGACWDTIHSVGQYKNHSKIEVRDRPKEIPRCQENHDDRLEHWCEGCIKPVCTNCKDGSHRGHKFVTIEQFVKNFEEETEISLDGVQSSLSYRCNRAEKMAVEIKKENENNKKEVEEKINHLQAAINRHKETLLKGMEDNEEKQMNEIKDFKRQVQGEQKHLIKEIFYYVTVNKDKEPQKMAEAKRRFNTYKETATGKLLQLKIPPRIHRHISGLDKLENMATDIGNIKLETKPLVLNERLGQKLTSGKNGQELDLASLELKDQDIEILTDELATNTTLMTLKLNNNQISDHGTEHLAELLRMNKTLKTLELHTNQIEELGKKLLTKAQKFNKTLNDLRFELPPPPDYQNPALEKRIVDSRNSTQWVWHSSNYNDKDMRIIAEELKVNKTLKDLLLYTNQIGDIGAQHLATALKENKTLTLLHLYNNQITDTGAQYLTDALKVNKTLTQLYLGGNKITDTGAQQLAHALKQNKTLTHLYLNQNQITDAGAGQLANALKDNKTLAHLWLHQNQITDRGAQLLAEALKNNQTLTILHVHNNQITDTGAQHFAEALKTNKTLQLLYLPTNTISSTLRSALPKQDNRIRFS